MLILEGIKPDKDGKIDYSSLPIPTGASIGASYNQDGTFTVIIKELNGK